MRKLRDFLNKHQGETAWMFGKGPSIDRFNMADAGPLRCAINDVVQAVPNCVYCFANDNATAWKDLYQPEHILFTPDQRPEDRVWRRPVFDGYETIVYQDTREDVEGRLEWSREKLADGGLAIRSGTLGSALQILYIMGVAKIVCVGIDGGGQHAEGHQWRTRLRADHAQDYNRIRDQFILHAEAFRIAVEFFGLPANANSNGMTTIKVLHDMFIRGQPFRTGDVTSVNPGLAQTLINTGRAVEFQHIEEKEFAPIDSPTVETAEAAPEVEIAARKPRRSVKRLAV